MCLPSALADPPTLSAPSPTPTRPDTGVSCVDPLALSLHGTPVVARIVVTRIAVIGDYEDTLVTAGVKNPGPSKRVRTEECPGA